jgi:hypothetical protein
MSQVNCKIYDDTSFLIPKKYGKTTYENVVKKLGGEWLPSKGWKISYDEQSRFIDYTDLLFTNVKFIIEPRPDTKKPSDDIEQVDDPVENIVPSGRFRRARSIDKTKSLNHKKYYDMFKKSPDEFGKLVFDDDPVQLSSSDDDSDDDSQSSEDYPNRSPSRNLLVNDETVDKLEIVRRRMLELDVKDNTKKKNKK